MIPFEQLLAMSGGLEDGPTYQQPQGMDRLSAFMEAVGGQGQAPATGLPRLLRAMNQGGGLRLGFQGGGKSFGYNSGGGGQDNGEISAMIRSLMADLKGGGGGGGDTKGGTNLMTLGTQRPSTPLDRPSMMRGGSPFFGGGGMMRY